MAVAASPSHVNALRRPPTTSCGQLVKRSAKDGPTPLSALLPPPTHSYGELEKEFKAAYVATVPRKYQPRMLRVLCDERASYRDRITATCLACANFQIDEVTWCTVWKCPLHSVRPYQSTGAEATE